VQSLSVWGKSQLSASIIYAAGMLILQTYPGAMSHAMRAMVHPFIVHPLLLLLLLLNLYSI
jgi:hypothetical protein